VQSVNLYVFPCGCWNRITVSYIGHHCDHSLGQLCICWFGWNDSGHISWFRLDWIWLCCSMWSSCALSHCEQYY